MSIEKIKNKIKKEAEDEAKKVKQEIEKEIEQIKQTNKDKTKVMRSEKDNETKTAVQLLKDKTLAQARLNSKRKLLEKREEIIEEVVQDATKKFIERPKEYNTFLEKTIKQNKTVLQGKLTVLGNKKDKEAITKILSALKIEGKFQETDIDAGIIIQDAQGKRINESLPARLEQKRNEIRQTIVKSMKI